MLQSFSCVKPSPNPITKFISDHPYLSLLETKCTNMKDLKKIHAQLIKTGLVKDIIAASRVLAFSASPAGDINYASSFFARIEHPNLFAWNTVIRAFSRSSNPEIAISLFIHMLVHSSVEPERLTYPSVFKAYAQLGLACYGRQLHGRVIKQEMELDVVAWNSMVIGLAKCGEIDEARKLFDKMPTRNTVSWNSMISGYVRNAITQGKWIHDYILNQNFELNPILVTAIIDMYCKCGDVEMAVRVFQTSPEGGLSCWNAMILGLATNGCEREAILLFSELGSSSLEPDYVSFIGVLMACNHAGMVDKARQYFSSMTEKYKIEPSIKHYSCMVDVLGNAGFLEEAEQLITSMPIDGDVIIWGSLLSACRKHGNVEMAKRAAKHVTELDRTKAPDMYLCLMYMLQIGNSRKPMSRGF
ncbi:Pentatricopeptide repeat-containing protein [Hibiscus syriacus]|uniref:Pentatricopeptide repeat-containing protein n=1 Tax=Hibiscus syriacus TaxID=106335 RepID=A0A6A3CY83_HIBSY|nr:Pentatricopeptide repeat-containing protein [Hibiscus syriacus]